MKDYRNLKLYDEDEWENDKEWQGKRMSFLWDVRYYKPSLYSELKLGKELKEFYDYNDQEVARIAHYDHYSVDMEMYRKMYQNFSLQKEYEDYQDLKRLLEYNFREFLLKKNCNRYEYLRQKAANGDYQDLIYEC